MLTPSQISSKPATLPLTVPAYDFVGQSRWDGVQMMGKYTSASIQTFDYHGKPKDSQSDQND